MAINSRNMTLAVLVVAIAAGVFYMIDPTLGGLLGRREPFYNEVVPIPDAAASMSGETAGEFANSGAMDTAAVMGAPSVVGGGEMSPMGSEVTEGFENLSPSPMPFASAEKPANCYPKNQLAPQELLPGDPNSKWAQVNPMGSGDIAGKNFLNAGSLIGVNTVSSSLRNASWDLRSEPPNPQTQVGPWNTSTIQPDISRRPLEIG